MTRKQKKLRLAHGTPAEFALACYLCVPSDISMNEAADAIEKYQREWDQAGIPTRPRIDARKLS